LPLLLPFLFPLLLPLLLPFGRTNPFMLSDKWTEELRIEGLRNSEVFFCCSLAHSPEFGLNLQVKYQSACPIEGAARSALSLKNA
jgi:hypothetical protein